MEEARNYTPSLAERIAGKIAGDDYNAERKVAEQLGAVGDLAHIGSYATPAAPAVGAYDLFNLGKTIADPVMEFLGSFRKSPMDAPEVTRDEFFAKKRSPRKSLSDAQSEAEAAVRSSKPYEDALAQGRRTTAQRMIDAARTNAAKAWEADQTNLATEEQRIETDWQADLADRKARSDAEKMKPWYERYPGSGELAVGLGSIGSAFLARRGFNKIADEANALLKAVVDARASGNLAKEAEALAALDAHRRSMPGQYAWTSLKAAAVPTELRAVGTGIDALTMPDVYEEDGSANPNSAKQQAWNTIRHTFGSPAGGLEELGPSLLSGATGAGVGGLFARKPHMGSINAQRLYVPDAARGRMGGINQSPDEFAIALGDKRKALLDQQRELDALRARPALRPLPDSRPLEPAAAPTATSVLEDLPTLPRGLRGGAALEGPTKSRKVPTKTKAAKPKEASSKGPSNQQKSSSTTPEQRDAASTELKRFLRTDQDKDGFATGGRVNAKPSDAQKEAGNYKKDHIRFQGLDITVENPKGSTRSGTDKGGKRWSVRMPASYGYFKRTEGKDGDHVDCYIGPDKDADDAHVIDQVDANTGRFDEHKVMIGFGSKDEALDTYRRCFSDGRGSDRLGGVKSLSMNGLKTWLQSGNTKAPIARRAYASGGAVHGDEPIHAGPLHSTVAGRTDHLPISVTAGSYVVPADIVSALGEGNTNAGMEIVQQMFPAQPQKLQYARGGKVPIAAAGGEFVLTPEQVAEIGGGDLDLGHEILDDWVRQTRAHTINTLQSLPGPAR